MCTVVIRVPEPGAGPVRVLAVRDEDPQRPWRSLGAWWPDRPAVRGVLDELAGGAWLAVDDSNLAVLLNRAGGAEGPDVTSRGSLVLDALAGRALPDPLTTLGFNLVQVTADGVRVTSWEGGAPRVVDLAPGTHMIDHRFIIFHIFLLVGINKDQVPRLTSLRDQFLGPAKQTFNFVFNASHRKVFFDQE